MKSILVLAAGLLVAASASAAEPQKPVVLAAADLQASAPATIKAAQPAGRAVAKKAAADTRFDNYNLETFGCCGLK